MHKIGFFPFTDVLACVTPVGLCLGRLANFVNGELYGRATDVPWAVIFPRGGGLPRHPSQLYEAGLEGLLLFAIMLPSARRKELARAAGISVGMVSAFVRAVPFRAGIFPRTGRAVGFCLGRSDHGSVAVPADDAVRPSTLLRSSAGRCGGRRNVIEARRLGWWEVSLARDGNRTRLAWHAGAGTRCYAVAGTYLSLSCRIKAIAILRRQSLPAAESAASRYV